MPQSNYHQPMIYVAVALMVGIMVGNGVGMSVGVKTFAIVFCMLLALTGVAYCRNKILCDICLILSAVTFGAFLESRQIEEQRIALPKGRTACQAIVVGMPQQHGRVIQADAQIVTLNGRQLRPTLKARLSFLRDTLSGDAASVPALGDGIAFSSRLQQPGEGYRTNVDSHFDSRRWLLSQGYRAQTLISPYDWHRMALPLCGLGKADRVRLTVGKWREQLLGQYRRMGIQGEQYVVLAAMTLGDKSCLTKRLRRVYSQTGTSHVLALSGLHLSIVFNILLLTFGLFRINRWVSYWLTLLVLWCFVVLVGMPVSVVRAAIMLSVGSVALLLHRRSASLSALSLAAVVVLVMNPESLWDVSFQLSFMAVLSLVIMAPLVEGLWRPRSRVVVWLWSTMRTSVIAQLGTAPLVVYYFGNLSVYFLPANLLVSLLSMPLLLLSFFFFLSLPLQWAHLACVSQMLSWLLSSAAFLLNQGLRWMSALPGAAVDNIAFSQKQVWLYYFVLACLLAAILYEKRIKSSKSS